jgi:hypothetical protein
MGSAVVGMPVALVAVLALLAVLGIWLAWQLASSGPKPGAVETGAGHRRLWFVAAFCLTGTLFALGTLAAALASS